MSGIAAYKENAVATQTKGKIVVLLYEGTVRFLRQAIQAIQKGDMLEKGRLINKATEIIIELSVSLDLEAGGEVAQNLRSLYNYIGEQLSRANVQCDVQALEDIISLLEELNDGWKQVAT